MNNARSSCKAEDSLRRQTCRNQRTSTAVILRLAPLNRPPWLTHLYLQELTYIIKQDIAGINKQIAQLQVYQKQRQVQKSRAPTDKLVEEHNANVVMLLQNKLANISLSFKDVLEIRTQVCLSKRCAMHKLSC